MVAVAGLLVCGLLLWWFLRTKKVRPAAPADVRREAHFQAAKSLELIGAVPGREAAVEASLVLRRYLAVVGNDPALYETREETLARHGVFNAFSEAARGEARRVFRHLAELKYAADVPSVAASDVVTEARALLETLHHGFQA